MEIEDTGSGISQENVKKIFNPFFTTKPAGKGTGLGLSISYGIVECFEGRINVEIKVGAGTTFTILLPGVEEEQMASRTSTQEFKR